jgi:putative selenate reductase molybdopterin-binding subunit
MTESLDLQINGQLHHTHCIPGTSLLTALQQQGWYGTHRVCESGDCGSCTVWVDDVPVHSCIYPAVHATDRSITTIEGLAQNGELSPMQAAFLEQQGFQCGYCTPGMIMSAVNLLADNPTPSEQEIREGIVGNLCRCTGYQHIVNAIQYAAKKGNAGVPKAGR